MVKEYERLCVSKQTYELVMKECLAEFRRQNPDTDDMVITQDFLVKRIALWYLK